MNIYFDIETNSKWDHIWVVVTKRTDTGEVQCHREPLSLEPLLELNACWIGHNSIGFDAWVLEKCWNLKIPLKNLIDTLVLSRLWNPELEKGHSLEAWGERFQIQKSLFNDFSQWSMELQNRCIIDVELTEKLHEHLTKQLQGWKQDCVALEHGVASVLSSQERNGWLFDDSAAVEFVNLLNHELMEIEEKMQSLFPPTVLQLKTKQKLLPFNPGSRKQIAERLIQKGWEPKLKTDQGTIVVNEKTLEACDIPESKVFLRYLLLQKRVSQVQSWIDAQKDDKRVHGRVNPNGAVTGRMTHYNPNMAQVPRVGSPFGEECRAFFIVPSGKRLVGVDASGLELRMLAHYMGDPNYVTEVTQGDVHTANQKAALLPTRNDAKTFIYAFLYGAGPAKIGSIVGGDAKVGACLIEKFLDNTPALKRLRASVATASKRGYLVGLDGRRMRIRSEHSALNTLLQGAGAVVMKKALVIFDEAVKLKGVDVSYVANVHDEFQLEVKEEHAEEVGKLAVWSIEEAGRLLSLKCPTTGEYRVGNNWKETH